MLSPKIARLSLVLWLIVITLLSLIPGNYIPPIHWEILTPDTIAHFVFYAALSLLMLFSQFKIKRILNISLAFFAGFVYGSLIEVIQGNYIEGRFFDYYDILSNSIGGAFGILIFILFFSKNNK